MKTTQILIVHIILILGYCGAQKTFRNPIIDESDAEPTILKYQDSYFLSVRQRNRIELLKSSTLSNFRNAERKEIHRDPIDRVNLYNPKMHFLLGDLYIYYSKHENVSDGTSRRMYAIKCLDHRDPLGAWSNETRILPEDEVQSVHGTVFQSNNVDLYYLWARRPANSRTALEIYIARMEHPLKVVFPGTLLRTPTMDWEKHVFSKSEAPFIIQHRGRTLLTFSASHHTSPNRCTGIMGIDGGRDPMLPSNWWDDVHHCAFARNDAEQVWAPGYASFVRSPDDSELWMLYDAWDHNAESGHLNRTARIQKIEWEFNTPIFPPAMGLNWDLVVPSGE